MKIHENTIENVTNLLAVIQEAGGSVHAFTWTKLQHMTAAELLNTLSPNIQMLFSFNKDTKEHISK